MAFRDQLLWTEALAYPLNSLAAIERGIVALNCNEYAESGPNATAELATDFEEYVNGAFAFQQFSMEYVREVRTQAWFGEAEGTVAIPNQPVCLPLERFVCTIADRLLRVSADVVTLQQPANNRSQSRPVGRLGELPTAGTDFWQRLGTRLCPELLLAARLTAILNGQQLLGQLRVQLDDLFRVGGPLADQHLHLGACLPLSVLWAQCLASQVFRDVECPEALRISGPTAVVDLRPVMAVAGVTRYALARFLADWSEWFTATGGLGAAPDQLSLYLKSLVQAKSSKWDLAEKLRHLMQGEVIPGQPLWAAALDVGRGIAENIQSWLAPWSVSLQDIVDEADGTIGNAGLGTPESTDPLAPFWPGLAYHDPAATIDPHLWFWGLKYLDWCGNRRDGLFATHFWNLVRCKNLFYRRLTQQEGFRGLTYFDHFYRRMRPFRRRRLYNRQIQIAEANINGSDRIGKLELRVGPSDQAHSAKDFRALLEDYRRLLESRGGRAARVGITVHLVKGWKDPDASAKPAPFSYPQRGDEYPEADRRFRYSSYLESRWRQMSELAALLNQVPSLSCFLRGIDVANRERTVPNWVVSHVFREFQYRLGPARIGVGGLARPMRFTMHAGEEFAHPVTGLRSMDEVRRWFGYETGKDRIGHGMALGLNLEVWRAEHSSVYVPIEEYLDDLIWQWMLFDYQELPNQGDMEALGAEIGRVAQALFDPQTKLDCHRIKPIPSPRTLLDAYRARFSPKILVDLGVFESDLGLLQIRPTYSVPLRELTESERVLHAYLFCEDLWRRAGGLGNWRVVVDNAYFDRLKRIQTWLRGKFGVEGLVVETCPSSNRLIGDLTWYQQHPVFQFAPPNDPSAGSVYFTVNADDPLTFNTNVAEELGHLRKAMIENLDVRQPLADDWIQRRVEEAWRSSFVFEFKGGSSGYRDQQSHGDLIRLVKGILEQLPLS